MGTGKNQQINSFNQSKLESCFNQPRCIFSVELAQQAFAVRNGSSGRDKEFFGNFFGRVFLHDEVQHFLFPACEFLNVSGSAGLTGVPRMGTA